MPKNPKPKQPKPRPSPPPPPRGKVNGHSSDCWNKVDEQLAAYNTRLARKFRVASTGFISQLVFIDTLSIETELIEKKRNGEKAKPIVPTYCPFCGKKL